MLSNGMQFFEVKLFLSDSLTDKEFSTWAPMRAVADSYLIDIHTKKNAPGNGASSDVP